MGKLFPAFGASHDSWLQNVKVVEKFCNDSRRAQAAFVAAAAFGIFAALLEGYFGLQCQYNGSCYSV